MEVRRVKTAVGRPADLKLQGTVHQADCSISDWESKGDGKFTEVVEH